MKLTNFSQRNLNVIENFIDYYTSDDNARDIMKECALWYIKEDHVDGEDSQEALLEIATSSDLILEDIELKGYEDYVTNVFFNKENGLIFSVTYHDYYTNVMCWKLTIPQDLIAKELRDEILTYRLGKYTDADEVSLGDIFMYGKFVECLSK